MATSNVNYYFCDLRQDLYFTGLVPSSSYFCYYQGNEVTPKTQMRGCLPGETLQSTANGTLVFSFYMNDGNIFTNAPIDLTTDVVTYDNDGYQNQQGNSVITIADINGNIVAQKNVSYTANAQAYFDKYTNPSSSNTSVSGNIVAGTITNPIIAQSFYIDPALVQNVTEVHLTSITVYPKSKPAPQQSNSGIMNPGVICIILPTNSGIPQFNPSLTYSSSRLEFTEIATSIDASMSSNFVFPTPVPLSTGQQYAFVLIPDQNEDFTFWSATYGQYLVGSANAISGPAMNPSSGSYFELSGASNNWNPISNTELKFSVQVARYAVNQMPVVNNSNIKVLRPRDYDFLLYDEVSSGDVRLAGGEFVFRLSNTTYQCNVVRGSYVLQCNSVNFSNLYSFNADEYVIINYGNGYYDTRKIYNFISNNQILVTLPFSMTSNNVSFFKSPVALANYTKITIANGGARRFVSIRDSNQNGSVSFANGDTLVGSFTSAKLVNCQFFNLPVSFVNPEIYINVPTGTAYSAAQMFNYTTTNDYDAVLDVTPDIHQVTMFEPYGFSYGEKVMYPSRTNELSLLANTNASSQVGSNSSAFAIYLNINNDFTIPSIAANSASCFFYFYCINDDYTAENTMYGNAFSKHITTKVNLDANVAAEDIQVYLSAFRPPNTDLKVFAKIYNSEDSEYFDDKDWTLLQELDGPSGPIYSAQQNTVDYIELTYGFYQYPNSAYTANGLVTCTLNSANVIGSQTTFGTDISVGNIVKIYQPLFPNDYIVASVTNITNTTLLTIDQPISNNGVTGPGLYIDKIAYPLQAYNNILNDNVVRYYNSSGVYFDTYDTVALKIVFLSDDSYTVPAVKNIRAVFVSS